MNSNKFLFARSKSLHNHGWHGFHKQRGVVLFVTLIVLVVMLVASVGLMRTVNTTLGAAGNIAFRKDAAAYGDRGLQQALADLGLPTFVAETDGSIAGYYSSLQTEDPRGIPKILVDAPPPALPGQSTSTAGMAEIAAPVVAGPPTAGQGNLVRYVIERMCDTSMAGVAANNIQTQPCIFSAGKSALTGDINEIGKAAPQEAVPVVSMRITVRIDGPKGSVIYQQALI